MILKPETKTRETIRSYVIRAGRMTSGQQRAIEALWSTYGRRVADGAYDIKPTQPLVLDIGFGNGHALANMAAANPDKHYVGVEVYPPGVGALLLEIEKQALPNIHVYCADVMLVLENCLPEKSLAGVQIFFPDPWHKKRHHKRRLIQPTFLDLLATRLQDNGFLHIATDWIPYAEYCQEILVAHPAFHIEKEAMHSRPSTKFEQRGRRLGHDVVDIIATRV